MAPPRRSEGVDPLPRKKAATAASRRTDCHDRGDGDALARTQADSIDPNTSPRRRRPAERGSHFPRMRPLATSRMATRRARPRVRQRDPGDRTVALRASRLKRPPIAVRSRVGSFGRSAVGPEGPARRGHPPRHQKSPAAASRARLEGRGTTPPTTAARPRRPPGGSLRAIEIRAALPLPSTIGATIETLPIVSAA